MGRKETLFRAPSEIRAHIEARFASGSLTLDELREELLAAFPDDAVPSRSALGRYGQKLARRLAAVKASAEAARLISEQVGDTADHQSEAVVRMTQSQLFDALMGLEDAQSEEDPVLRVRMLSEVAKGIATLTRSSVALKEYQAKALLRARQEVLAEQKQKLDELGRSGAVPPEVLQTVIKAAYDL